MELDTDDASVSYPIKITSTTSNGIVELTISNSSNISTNGYRLRYVNSNRTFIAERMVDNVPVPNESLIINENSNGGIWEAIYQGVSIKIIEGSNSFIDNDRFSFSTFKTQNPEGKVNVFNISDQAYNVFSPF